MGFWHFWRCKQPVDGKCPPFTGRIWITCQIWTINSYSSITTEMSDHLFCSDNLCTCPSHISLNNTPESNNQMSRPCDIVIEADTGRCNLQESRTTLDSEKASRVARTTEESRKRGVVKAADSIRYIMMSPSRTCQRGLSIGCGSGFKSVESRQINVASESGIPGIFFSCVLLSFFLASRS